MSEGTSGNIAAAKPSALVAKMNEIYKQCPKLRRIDFDPNIRMDTRSGRFGLRDWFVYLFVEDEAFLGNHADLDTAIVEAVDEYLAEYGPSKPTTEVEASNAAAMEEVERFCESTGPMPHWTNPAKAETPNTVTAPKYTPRGMCKRCGQTPPSELACDGLCGLCHNEVGEDDAYPHTETEGAMP